jgi:hypothetical protein
MANFESIREHFWRTAEERLAKTLAADGHKVALIHVTPDSNGTEGTC